MVTVVDRCAPVIGYVETLDEIYGGQTFVAAASRLDSIDFFMDGTSGTPLGYRVLVTTASFTNDGFHPGKVLFESGTLFEPIVGGLHKITINTAHLSLTRGQTYLGRSPPTTPTSLRQSSERACRMNRRNIPSGIQRDSLFHSCPGGSGQSTPSTPVPSSSIRLSLAMATVDHHARFL